MGLRKRLEDFEVRTMTTLHPARTDDAGRTTYAPVLARITGVSQYREDEYRLEGIEGFWAPGKNVTIPPILKEGGIAWYTLATKPKSGQNAKPGSLYRDIQKVAPATKEDKEAYNPNLEDMFAEAPQTHANGSGGGSGADYAEKTLPAAPAVNQWASKDASILKQVGFKAAVELLAAKMTAGKSAYDPFTEKEWGQLAQDVWLSYNLLLKGKNPESLYVEPEIEPSASAETVKNALFDDSTSVAERAGAAVAEAKADGEYRESLPW